MANITGIGRSENMHILNNTTEVMAGVRIHSVDTALCTKSPPKVCPCHRYTHSDLVIAQPDAAVG